MFDGSSSTIVSATDAGVEGASGQKGERVGAAQMFPANVERAYTYYAPIGSLWRSDTVVSVRPQGGLDERYELDLSTGEREAPTELALDRQTPDGRPQMVLASGAHAPGTFYTVPAQSCFGRPDEVTSVRVISDGGDRAVIGDPGDAFTGLAHMIFGSDGQVAWLNTCNSVSSVWVAIVDQATGEFHSVTRVLDGDWLATVGWGFRWRWRLWGPDAIAFEADGTLRAWAYTYEPGNPDPSTWTVDTATFTVEALAALPDS